MKFETAQKWKLLLTARGPFFEDSNLMQAEQMRVGVSVSCDVPDFAWNLEFRPKRMGPSWERSPMCWRTADVPRTTRCPMKIPRSIQVLSA